MIILRRRYFILTTAFMLLTVLSCYRERPSEQPPVHLNPNMDSQEKYKAQSKGGFFDDHSAMRMPVDGTIARGNLRQDKPFYEGKADNGDFITSNPIEYTEENLKRGRERYNIYCSVCHGRVGDSKSIVIEKGYLPPPSFHEDRIRKMPDGEIYNTITNGIRNMPSYKHQIPVEDRWKIIQYLRALQRSQNATEKDLPAGKIESLENSK